MRYRPKRENYAIGQFGEIDYQEMLERYCTYLENQNKQLRLHVVVSTSKCDHEPRKPNKKHTSCKKCDMHLQMKP